MIDLLVRIVVNAIALIVAARVVPDMQLAIPSNFDRPEQWLGIAAIALIFALVNTYLKPILKLLSLPISLLTMGLFSFVINAGLLLLVAWIADQLKDSLHTTFVVGHFPPTLDYTTLGAAVVASVVISLVATALNMLLVPRRAIGF